LTSGAGAAVAPRALAAAYHKLRGGIGEVMAVEPDWTALPSKAEQLFSRLGKKENGGIGPDLFRRDMGGTGQNVKPLSYEPTLGTSFPRIGEIDTFNFEQIMEAKDAYVRDLRNASQPLGPVALEHEVQVLDEDPRCGSARFDFHFTDISKTASDGSEFTNDNRRIFVREKTGVLRTASQDERDKSNQEFNAGKDEKAWLPVVFQDQSAYFRALEQFAHPYLLDEICRIRSATSADYVRVHEWTYNHVAEMGVFQVLQDTPHFHGLARWIFEEDMVGRLLVPLLKDGRVTDAADVVVAYCEERPTNAKVSEIELGVTAALRERMPTAVATTWDLADAEADAGVETAAAGGSGGGATQQPWHRGDTEVAPNGASGVIMEIPIQRKWAGSFVEDKRPEELRRKALEANEATKGSWVNVEWVDTDGGLAMAVSGSSGCVQTVADVVYRVTHDDILAHLYLKVYSGVQEYADMKKLIVDSMNKATIDDMLNGPR